MTGRSLLAERIRRGEMPPFPVAAALGALTPVMRLGMWRRRLARTHRVDAHVISIGNLTVGGTGKTPLVIARAAEEMARGRRVAVLTRGYGSGRRGLDLAVGGERPADAPWLGDEPELVLFRLPGVVVARCADRVAGARAAVREHGCDTLILDDGFQYLRLARDEDLVVLDATNPFGNGHLVPLGTLREPPAALSRATGIILTHCREPANADAVADDLAVRGIHALVQRTRHVPTALWNLGDGTPAPLSALNGATVRAVSGIGKPEGFAALLTGLGARVAEVVTLADHAEIPAQALRGAPKVVTTEKDAMRLRRRPLPEGAEAAWVLRIEARPV